MGWSIAALLNAGSLIRKVEIGEREWRELVSYTRLRQAEIAVVLSSRGELEWSCGVSPLYFGILLISLDWA